MEKERAVDLRRKELSWPWFCAGCVKKENASTATAEASTAAAIHLPTIISGHCFVLRLAGVFKALFTATSLLLYAICLVVFLYFCIEESSNHGCGVAKIDWLDWIFVDVSCALVDEWQTSTLLPSPTDIRRQSAKNALHRYYRWRFLITLQINNFTQLYTWLASL